MLASKTCKNEHQYAFWLRVTDFCDMMSQNPNHYFELCHILLNNILNTTRYIFPIIYLEVFMLSGGVPPIGAGTMNITNPAGHGGAKTLKELQEQGVHFNFWSIVTEPCYKM